MECTPYASNRKLSAWIPETTPQLVQFLAVFSWGHSFLDLNHSLLEKYSLAKNSSEVVQIQKEISKD